MVREMATKTGLWAIFKDDGTPKIIDVPPTVSQLDWWVDKVTMIGFRLAEENGATGGKFLLRSIASVIW